MTAMLIALAAAATAYTLEPFTIAHNTLERTNVTKRRPEAAPTTRKHRYTGCRKLQTTR